MEENYQTGVNVEYYKPLLNDFLKENKELFIQSGYPWGLFIPYTLPNYNQAPIKIFYVGLDTYYWVEKKIMLESFNKNRIDEYFEVNQSAVTMETTLNWGNAAGAFWSFVDKLHLYIRTGELKDLTNLEDKDKEIIKEVGYGNINCMELDNTLFNKEQEVSPNKCDLEKLYALRQQSWRFDKISHILNAYKPDIIVILTWSGSEDYIDVEHTWLEEYFKYNLHSVYSIKDYDTKVIWSSHPRRFSFIGENQESMVHKLGNLVLNLSNQ